VHAAQEKNLANERRGDARTAAALLSSRRRGEPETTSWTGGKMPSQPRSELEQSLLQLIDSKVISGYTLFHSSGSVVMQEGDDQIDGETLSAVSHNFDAPGASDEDQHAPSYMLPAGRHDADTQRELSHNGERLTVVRKPEKPGMIPTCPSKDPCLKPLLAYGGDLCPLVAAFC
jgi:hypothetical protein